jgi:serine protease Do
MPGFTKVSGDSQMKVWTTAAATLTLLTGLAIGTAVAPVRAQKDTIWEPAVVQVFGGGGRLGVSIRDTDADDLKTAKLQTPAGVVVEEVREESAAEKSGFKAGDIVVEFDGERVRSARQFTRLVQETSVERQVQTVVMRDGQRMTLSVQLQSTDNFSYFRDFSRGNSFKLAPRPPAPPAPPKPPVFDFLPRIERMFSSSGRLGITVDSLSEQLAGYFGTKDGVLVTSVNKDSAAAKAGLKAGDVITAIEGSTVDSPSDLSSQTQRLDSGTEFTLDIVRDKKPMTLKGKVEAPRARRWTVSTD